MAEAKINNLRSFLHQSGAKYRVFDMSRRVVKLSVDEFIGFEDATKPYPYPIQRAAHFGIIFWNPAVADTHYVWFLKLPLDEQGLLIQSARDEFLVMLLDRVGECMLAASDGKIIEGALKDSLYTFDPQEDKMAAFNAQASVNLGLKPSSYYEDALLYYTGQTDLANWQGLGKQGVADLASRLDDFDKIEGLAKTLPKLPSESFNVLCLFLENTDTSIEIVEVLNQKIHVALESKNPDIAVICSCLRAVSNSHVAGLVDQMVKTVLKHKCSLNIEVLATISGRIWRVLKQDVICQQFVERLAENDHGYNGFSYVLADAIYMPGLREPIMKALRSPTRSQSLTKRVGQMFGQS